MTYVLIQNWRRLFAVLSVSVLIVFVLGGPAGWEWPDAIRLGVQVTVLGLLILLLQHGEDDRRELRKMVVINERTLDIALQSLGEKQVSLEQKTAEIAEHLAASTAVTASAVQETLTKIGQQLVENFDVSNKAAQASAEAAHVANSVNEKIVALGIKVKKVEDEGLQELQETPIANTLAHIEPHTETIAQNTAKEEQTAPKEKK